MRHPVGTSCLFTGCQECGGAMICPRYATLAPLAARTRPPCLQACRSAPRSHKRGSQFLFLSAGSLYLFNLYSMDVARPFAPQGAGGEESAWRDLRISRSSSLPPSGSLSANSNLRARWSCVSLDDAARRSLFCRDNRVEGAGSSSADGSGRAHKRVAFVPRSPSREVVTTVRL